MDYKTSYEDLKGRIEEALDYIKDDPKLEKEMDEIPRLNYILDNIKSTLDGPFRDFSEPEYRASVIPDGNPRHYIGKPKWNSVTVNLNRQVGRAA